MTAAITLAVAALMGLVVLLVLALTAVRVAIRRRRRREQRLWPATSEAIARYVTGVDELPRPAGPAERAMFRTVALATLADLRGSEHDIAVGMLSELGYVAEAEDALTARRSTVRRRAAELLALAATADSAPALISGLDDRDPLVRTSCARTFARVGPADAAPLAAATAERDMVAVPGAAAAVVLALGRTHRMALLPLLQPGVPQQVRLVAVAVAGRLRLAELAPALRECLHDGDELAAAAAEGLGMIGDIQAVPGLQELARDRAPHARAAAVTALGSIGDPGSVPVLEPLLNETDWTLRAGAARALTRLGEPGTAALHRAAVWGPPEAREQAEAALQR